MANVRPPPNDERIAGRDGKATLSYIEFFENLFRGDVGTAWTPAFTDLTITGTPTITGRVYKLSQKLAYFAVTITPATDTSSVAGTTYINNFPLTLSADGACLAVSGLAGTAAGHCVAANNRIYTPAWTSVTVALTVVGLVEAR